MQQLYVFYGIAGFTIILGALVFFIFWSLSKMHQRQQAALEQLSLFAEVMAQEKDKARITDKLHENFGATLSVIKLYMGNFTLTDEDELEQRETAKQHIDGLIKQIREIALKYLPYSLQRSKLDDTLRDYVKYINENYQQLVTLEIKEELPHIPTHKAVNIYRILQEIVENTLNHAQATELIITIKKDGAVLRIITRDNGVGFDYEKALQKKDGLGLNTINTRVKLLKGKLQVSSAAGGTMYGIEVPV